MDIHMPKELIYILLGLVVGSWFLIGENMSLLEKLFTLVFVVFLYFGFMLFTGASIDDILAIFR